ncbi:hypothetical protein TGVAND_229720 [Toxoplasma gondii VAND]|uniref:Uncharacterized protein n=1 Tax=Toxoplasma gondii VAND TaxID=933077 RepID=A0A086PRS9_TOXGO|nr:hypothetical protein TGVAND_229720 [Toxoplasma gondii VAND]
MKSSDSFHLVHEISVPYSTSALDPHLLPARYHGNDTSFTPIPTVATSPQPVPNVSMDLASQGPLPSTLQCPAAPSLSTAVDGGPLVPGFLPPASSGVVSPSSSLLLSSAPPPVHYNAFQFYATAQCQQQNLCQPAASSWGPATAGVVASSGSSQLSGSPFLPVFLPPMNSSLYVTPDPSANVLSSTAVHLCVSSSVGAIECPGLGHGDSQQGPTAPGTPLAGRDDASLVGLNQGGSGACMPLVVLASPSVYSLMPQQQHMAASAVYEQQVRGWVPYGFQSSEQAYWALSSRSLHSPALCGVAPTLAPVAAPNAASMSRASPSETLCVDSQNRERTHEVACESVKESQGPLTPIGSPYSPGQHAAEVQLCDGYGDEAQGREEDCQTSTNCMQIICAVQSQAVEQEMSVAEAGVSSPRGLEGDQSHGLEETRPVTPEARLPVFSADCPYTVSAAASGSVADDLGSTPGGYRTDPSGEAPNRRDSQVPTSSQEIAASFSAANSLPGDGLADFKGTRSLDGSQESEAALDVSPFVPANRERGPQEGGSFLRQTVEGGGRTRAPAGSYVRRKKVGVRGLAFSQGGAPRREALSSLPASLGVSLDPCSLLETPAASFPCAPPTTGAPLLSLGDGETETVSRVSRKQRVHRGALQAGEAGGARMFEAAEETGDRERPRRPGMCGREAEVNLRARLLRAAETQSQAPSALKERPACGGDAAEVAENCQESPQSHHGPAGASVAQESSPSSLAPAFAGANVRVLETVTSAQVPESDIPSQRPPVLLPITSPTVSRRITSPASLPLPSQGFFPCALQGVQAGPAASAPVCNSLVPLPYPSFAASPYPSDVHLQTEPGPELNLNVCQNSEATSVPFSQFPDFPVPVAHPAANVGGVSSNFESATYAVRESMAGGSQEPLFSEPLVAQPPVAVPTQACPQSPTQGPGAPVPAVGGGGELSSVSGGGRKAGERPSGKSQAETGVCKELRGRGDTETVKQDARRRRATGGRAGAAVRSFQGDMPANHRPAVQPLGRSGVVYTAEASHLFGARAPGVPPDAPRFSTVSMGSVQAVTETSTHAPPARMCRQRDPCLGAFRSDLSLGFAAGRHVAPLRSAPEPRSPSAQGAAPVCASDAARGGTARCGVGLSHPGWAEETSSGSWRSSWGEGGKQTRERRQRSHCKMETRDREAAWVGSRRYSQQFQRPLTAVRERHGEAPGGGRGLVNSTAAPKAFCENAGARPRPSVSSTHQREGPKEPRKLPVWRPRPRSFSIAPLGGGAEASEDREGASMASGPPEMGLGARRHARPKRRSEGQMVLELSRRATEHCAEEPRGQAENGGVRVFPETQKREELCLDMPAHRWRERRLSDSGLLRDASGIMPPSSGSVPPTRPPPPGQRPGLVSEEVSRAPHPAHMPALTCPFPGPPLTPAASGVEATPPKREAKHQKPFKRGNASRGWAPMSPSAASRSPLLWAPPSCLFCKVPAGPPLPGPQPSIRQFPSCPNFASIPSRPPPPIQPPPPTQPPPPGVAPPSVVRGPRRPLSPFSPSLGRENRFPLTLRGDGEQPPGPRLEAGACSSAHVLLSPTRWMQQPGEARVDGSGERRRGSHRSRQGPRKGELHDLYGRRQREGLSGPAEPQEPGSLRWRPHAPDGVPCGVAPSERFQKQGWDPRLERGSVVDREDHKSLLRDHRLAGSGGPSPHRATAGGPPGVSEGGGRGWTGGACASPPHGGPGEGDSSGALLHAAVRDGRQEEGHGRGQERDARPPPPGEMLPCRDPEVKEPWETERSASEGSNSSSAHAVNGVEAPVFRSERGNRERGARTHEWRGRDKPTTQVNEGSPLSPAHANRGVYIQLPGHSRTERARVGSFPGAEVCPRGWKNRRGRGGRGEDGTGEPAFAGRACTPVEPTGEAVRVSPGTGAAMVAREYAPGRDTRHAECRGPPRSVVGEGPRREADQMRGGCKRDDALDDAYRMHGFTTSDGFPVLSRAGDEVYGSAMRGGRGRLNCAASSPSSYVCGRVYPSSLASPFSASLPTMAPLASVASPTGSMSPAASSESFFASSSVSSFPTVSSASSLYRHTGSGAARDGSWTPSPVSPVSRSSPLSPMSALGSVVPHARGAPGVQSEETPFVSAQGDAAHSRNFDSRLPRRPRTTGHSSPDCSLHRSFLGTCLRPLSLCPAPLHATSLSGRDDAERRQRGSEGKRRNAGTTEEINGEVEVKPRPSRFFPSVYEERVSCRRQMARDEENDKSFTQLVNTTEITNVLGRRRRPVRH